VGELVNPGKREKREKWALLGQKEKKKGKDEYPKRKRVMFERPNCRE